MVHSLLLPDLKEMLHEKDALGLREFATGLHPATVAEAAEGLEDEQIWQLLSYAPLPTQSEVFGYFPLARQIEIVEGAGRERMSRLVETMASDDRVALLNRLDPAVVDSLLPLVAHADRQDIRQMLSYAEGSVGSVMTSDYASLPSDLSAEEAISRLRRQAPDRETIYYIYILDGERHLLGLVTLRQLILAKPQTKVADLMRSDPIAVRVDDDRELVARTLAKYNFLAVPVVDNEKRLVGIVTHDDVLDVLEEETTEDAHRFGAVQPMDEGYLEADFRTVWQKRAVWLSCLFIAELFTFTALAHFEHAIEKVVVLSLFVPLCISTGGNSGSQAATLITRAMALGQVRISDWWSVLRHELVMGLALGCTLGLIGFFRAYFTPTSVLGVADPLGLAIVIALAVTVICIWGTLVGSMLPLIFQRLGFDPGYASSPFVATFVDVTGIIIYFSLAQVYLFSG